MTNKGKNLMTEEAWNEIHKNPKWEDFGQWPFGDNIRTHFTQGGFNYFTKLENMNEAEKNMYVNWEGYYGWFGYGGSIFQWNPELKIGFAYVPTFLLFLEDMFNSRGSKLQKLVTECCKKSKK